MQCVDLSTLVMTNKWKTLFTQLSLFAGVRSVFKFGNCVFMEVRSDTLMAVKKNGNILVL